MYPSRNPILLIEDDDVDAMTLRRAFRDIGVANPLVRAENGEVGLAKLADPSLGHPCVILLDLNMPIMNGIEFLRVVKSHPQWRRIPVIVLTTSREAQDKIASFDLSVAGYMTKPVDYPKFVDAVRTIESYWTLSEAAPH